MTGFGFLTVSVLGLLHPLQEVKHVPSNEIFFFFSLSSRFKGVEMLGSFCLPFGKEKCSPQIPVALLESEIQGISLRAGRGTSLIRQNTSIQASASQTVTN